MTEPSPRASGSLGGALAGRPEADGGGPQLQIDSRAIELAREALTLIQRHIAECDRREDQRLLREAREHDESVAHRKDVKDSLDRLSSSVAELRQQVANRDRGYLTAVIGFAGSVIIGLLGLVAYLLVEGAPWWLPGTSAPSG